MLKKFLKNLVILFNLLVLFSYLNADNLIITSVYPLKLVLQEIIPKEIKVINVIPPNVNPHIFEPTPNTIKAIEKADVFIGIQKDFDGWIEKNLKNNAKILYLNKSKSNPHIWLSPKIILGKIDLISKILVEKFPNKKNAILLKSENFKKKLLSIVSQYKEKFKSLKNRNIIEVHSAFDYLAKDFSLKIKATIFVSEHQEISVKHYIEIIKIAKKEDVKVIFASSNIHSNILNNLKNDLKIKIVSIDPLGSMHDNYFNFIKHILEKIYNSLKSIE